MKRKLTKTVCLICLCGLCLSGAPAPTAEAAVSTGTVSAEDSAAAADAGAVSYMSFTDVYGDVHIMTIDETARFHDYEPSFFVKAGQTMLYADTSTYTARIGIDVSYYQGKIDWERVRDAGITFAFIRAGYRSYGSTGSLIEDTRFRDNLEGARAAGLDVGVYLFSQAVSEAEAAEEAAYIAGLLGDTELELPVVYDPEFILDADGNKLTRARTSTLTGEQITANTLTFCSLIRAAGFEPAVYSNLLSQSEVFDMTALSDCTIWYADYCDTPQTPYQFTYWQYSASGTVDGIDGAVDLDIQMIPVDER